MSSRSPVLPAPRARARASTRSPDVDRLLWISVAAAGLIAGLAICAIPSAPGKGPALLVAAAAGAALLPVAAYFPRLVEEATFFALALTFSVSLKFHPVFRTDHIGGAIGLRVSITDLLLALLAVAILARKRQAGALRFEADTAILASFGLYWALGAASTLAGSDLELGAFQLVACLQSFVVFVFLVSYVRTRRRLVILLAGMLVALCLQSAVAVAQTRFPDWSALQALGAPEDQELSVVDGDVALPDVDLGATVVQGEVQKRPAGLLIHPNVLGFYLVLGTLTALGVFLAAETSWLSGLGLVAFLLSAAALYVSLSRSGWAGAAFAIALAAVVGRNAFRSIGRTRRTIVAGLALAACLLLALKADRIYSRIADTADEAIDFRRNLAAMALRMIAAHPFAGVGLNGFEEASPAFDPTGEQRIKRFPVHDVYLLEASEVGLPGGLAFVALVACLITRTLRSAVRCPPAGRWLPLLVASGIAGFWFAQTSDFVYRIPILTTLLWAHAALAFASARVTAREGRP
jgi:hypothetical protein